MTSALSRNIKAFYFLARKNLFRIQDESIGDIQYDQIGPFSEYVPCPVCLGEEFIDKFRRIDGMSVNECIQCGLLQTRPRIDEEIWVEWLMQDSERSRKYTENRLQYGYALDHNIKYSTSFWYLRKRWKYERMFNRIKQLTGQSIRKVHDVGCGVGFLLREARRMKILVSGNDLNQYAVGVMRERYGLEVACGTVEAEPVQRLLSGSDLVTMTDYIEHSYHPDQDLKIIQDQLVPNGIVYLTTFHTDCRQAEKYGPNWNMYCWNHVYHFDRQNLEALVTNAGFKIIHTYFPYLRPHCEILARK